MTINNYASRLNDLSWGLNPNRKVSILLIEKEPGSCHSVYNTLKGVVIGMTSDKEHGIFRIKEKNDGFRDVLFAFNDEFETWEYIEHSKQYLIQHHN